MPLVDVPVAGGPWFAGDLVPSPLLLAVTSATVIGVGLVSALAGLRRVRTDALGVATNRDAGRAGWWRALALLAAMAVFAQVVRGDARTTTTLVAAWGAVLVAASVVGPLVVRLAGAVWARLARGPVSLLAARRLLDDPTAVHRQLSGLAFACLVVGLLAGLPGGVATASPEDDRLLVAVEDDRADDVVEVLGSLPGLPAGASIELRPGDESWPTEVVLDGTALGVVALAVGGAAGLALLAETSTRPMLRAATGARLRA